MDRHKVGLETTPEDVAAAHALDQQVEEKYGVKYLTYWFDRSNGGIFCLAQAPSKEAAIRVHAEAHGLLAEDLIEVEEGPVVEYLGRTADPPATPIADSAFRTIVFTDIVGSTSTTQRIGDLAAMEMLREHNEIVRAALRAHEGREVKHTGDGIMACFQSVTNALQSTIDVQRALLERNRGRGDDAVGVRVGLSAGEPVEDSGDLFGSVVQMARRVCDAGEAGSILTSNVIRELAMGKGFTFKDRGESMLKGFSEPARLYELHWHPE
jgi:class 3 adenylate cyclase